MQQNTTFTCELPIKFTFIINIQILQHLINIFIPLFSNILFLINFCNKIIQQQVHDQVTISIEKIFHPDQGVESTFFISACCDARHNAVDFDQFEIKLGQIYNKGLQHRRNFQKDCAFFITTIIEDANFTNFERFYNILTNLSLNPEYINAVLEMVSSNNIDKINYCQKLSDLNVNQYNNDNQHNNDNQGNLPPNGVIDLDSLQY